MGKTVKYTDPNFDKKTYWDRRKKGYRGQIAAPGTREFNHEQRKLGRNLMKANLEALKGDKNNERQKRKSVAKSV